ncbi:MAG: TonB-dependent receptor [Phenylobacterium sp.]
MLTHTGASLAVLAALLAAPAAYAQSAVSKFALPAQPLAAALLQFGQQARVSVAAPQDLIAGRTGGAVSGDMTAQQALTQLLAPSGLRFEFVRPGAVRIVPARFPDAVAPPVLEELIVTATKRAESQRDVPIAITAFGQRTLERLGPTNIQDAMRFVPGVNFSSNGGNSVNYTIRGVNTGAATGNVQSTVALYVDDLSMLDPYYPKITTNLRLFDVERVEVLRGPQGTLFGSGALGGAIRLVTNKPSLDHYAASAETSLQDTKGGDTGYTLNAMVNAPLVDGILAVRAVGYYQRDGGYVDNTRRGQQDVNSMTSRGGRVALTFEPTDVLRLTATALAQNDKPKDSAYTLYAGPTDSFNGYQPNRFPQDLKIYSLTGDYDAGFADLTSITSYADKHEFSRIDFTARSMAITGAPGLSTISNFGPSHTFSQEVRLASKAAGPFQWLIGGIYSRNNRQILEQIVTAGAAAIPRFGTDLLVSSDFRRKTEETALFGEASYQVTAALKLTAGARAFWNKIDVHEVAGGPLNTPRDQFSSIEQNKITPKVAATYTVNRQVTVYAQAAQGYRIGQNNVTGLAVDPSSGEQIPAAYGPDKLWNYEVGAKSSWLDGRLNVDAAAYLIDWKDIQLAARTNGNGLNYIGNAGDARIKGLELNVRALPTDAWEIGSSLSVIDSEMTAIRNNAVGYKGQRLPASARITVASYLQYSFPAASGRGYARLDHRYIGSQIDRLGPGALRYGDFSDVNARVGVDFGTYEIAGFVTNLADGDAIESALAVQTVNVAIRQRPRTIGVILRAKY